MPEWSIGAVSKTVDHICGPRVRIPFSPQKLGKLLKIILNVVFATCFCYTDILESINILLFSRRFIGK